MISVEHLSFGYGKRSLFQDLSLELAPGGIGGLLGLNGAGKTSFLKLLAGALGTQAGAISVAGRTPFQKTPEHLADTVFVAEDPWVPDLTVDRWVGRVRAFRPAFETPVWESACAEFEIGPGARMAKLSYGQRKKAVLAAALASGARTLLLDEPTNGLDIPAKGQFRRVLAGATRPDRVILVSTHQIRDLETLFDSLMIMDAGRVPFVLDPDTLADKVSTVRLGSLDSPGVVWAVRDSLGWSAVVAGPSEGARPDLELVFSAAVAQPQRLAAVLGGRDPGPLPEGGF